MTTQTEKQNYAVNNAIRYSWKLAARTQKGLGSEVLNQQILSAHQGFATYLSSKISLINDKKINKKKLKF